MVIFTKTIFFVYIIDIIVINIIIQFKKISYRMEQLQQVNRIYDQVDKDFKLYFQYDPQVRREDTCIGMKAILNKLRGILDIVNGLSVQLRIENYFYTHNAVIYILDICKLMRKSEYSFECIDYLLHCILSMQSNLILQDTKYLDLRVKLYLQVAHIYEQQEAFQPAINLLTVGIEKLNQLMTFHEADPPVPEYIRKIIQQNIKLLKIMLLKYKIQAGVVLVNDWRKKVDEEFGNDNQSKLICLIQCLRTRTSKSSNIFQQKKINFKQSLVKVGFQMMKADLALLSTALEQQKAKIQRIVDFKNTVNITQELTNQQIKKRREFQEKLIKQKDYIKASQNVPLQYHCELLHYAYEVKNLQIFQELANWATIRIKCRRLQIPYIVDVSILASSSPNPNIPNEYEKLPYDLNEANMKIALNKLRNSGKVEIKEKSEEIPQKIQQQAAKDIKKGVKQPMKPTQEQNKEKQIATPWELEQIKHKYVFLLLKRSMNPERAIYNIDIVMGHEEHGPTGYQDTRRIIVPYIQENSNMSVKTSEIQQYTGVRQTTHLVPYIILYHSKDSLNDENQRKSIVTDVKPIFGKNPIVRPEPGYKKIEVDLRQVPKQFIRSKQHDYVYLSYKTDHMFSINQRHTQILIALNDLESTYAKNNGFANNVQQQKSIELQLNFDMNKLDGLFEAMERSLRGELGEEYYSNKIDFLTHLLHYLWMKYIRGPLIQFDYVYQQRLTNEIIDLDFQYYKNIIKRAKIVFIKGLKVFNLILVENPKVDMLLLCKVNLQLTKLLEEQEEYRIAIENIKFCLTKIEDYRNQYLSRGLHSKNDKLLPFSITCSNRLLKQTLIKIKEKYLQQRLFIAKQLRINQRVKQKKRSLTDDQLKEQEFEFSMIEQKEDTELKDLQKQKHNEFILILMSLHTDIINHLFRLQLKQSQRERKLNLSKKKINDNPTSKGLVASGLEEEQLAGIPSSLKQKVGLMYTNSQVQTKTNLRQLQSTLQKGGKLEAPKPNYSQNEKKLIQTYSSNPYLSAILHINLAATKPQEKQYLLKQSLRFIEKIRDEEKVMMDKAITNSIFLISTLWDQQIEKISSKDIFPFTELYNGTWPSQAPIPPAPILVSRSSDNLTFKFPPFTPIISNEKDINELKLKKNITSMTLYGKISAHGVDVSTNCNSLVGTGIKKNVGSIVRVKNLDPNVIYCFACAATNGKDELGSIGKTGEDIGTYHAHPINLILYLLAKTAFQLGEYNTAKMASNLIIQEFCETSNYIDYDMKQNSLYYYRFKQKVLNSISILQIRALAQSLILAARCLIQETSSSNRNKLMPLQKKYNQNRITNLLVLATSLVPSLPTPLQSLPFLLPSNNIIQSALLISVTPQKFMSPRLRKLASKVMYGILKWGLQKNQIALARRIAYKWGERKWMMLGKSIQIEQKKEIKKGKDTKEQEIKIIDKYIRLLVQKSPTIFDTFEDNLILLHQEYNDYAIMFIQRAKQQINYYSQYTENPPEEIEKMINQFNFKLDLIEYLKQPVQSLNKIPQASPFYLEGTCKILKKAIQSNGDPKQINDLCAQIPESVSTPAIKIALEVYDLIMESIKNDIDFSPENIKQLKILQEKTGEDLSKSIQIFQKYIDKMASLIKQHNSENLLTQKSKEYEYVNMWLSELHILKATNLILLYTQTNKPNPDNLQTYFNATTIDLQDLTKKIKQKGIIEKTNYLLDEKLLDHLNKIFKAIALACYHSYLIENWNAVHNSVKLAFNFITYYMLTPFSHWRNSLYLHLTFISLISTMMLKKIKLNGFHTYKKRYQRKLAQKEVAFIENKLGLSTSKVSFVQNQYTQEYFRPVLEAHASKNFWFTDIKDLDIDLFSNFLAYTIQSLRIQQKYHLIINLIREYSNVTKHYHSLYFLPFIIDSQDKLILQINNTLNKKKEELQAIVDKYNIWKNSKKKGSRQAQLTGQKPKEQIEFEIESTKLNETINLITEKLQFFKQEERISQNIIEELKRDTNQAGLMQKEQHKLLSEFANDEVRIYRQYGQKSKFQKNRKNVIREIIRKYTEVYNSLKNNKTSQDTLSEIQNLNEVGNLYFAAGNIDKATEYWNDSLATITKTVNPIINQKEIFEKNGIYIVNTFGLSQTFLAINLTVKLAWISYYKSLHQQKQATMMGAKLIQNIFHLDASHPQTLKNFATYRLTQIKQTDVFVDQVTVNLTQLLNSCVYISWSMFDYNQSIKILPALTLLDYISTDIVKNNYYSMKAKLMKSLALADIGMITQAIIYLQKAAFQKDMPILWIRLSQFVKRQRGSNWYPDQNGYNNSLGSHQPNNKQILENIRKIQVAKTFQYTYGWTNNILFNYAKAMILLSANQTQIFENSQLNQQRINMLNASQIILRDCLKRLGFLEEYFQYLLIYKKKLTEYKNSETDDQLKKKHDQAKQSLISYLKSQGIEDINLHYYLNQQPMVEKRTQRLRLIGRIRNTLSRCNQAKNMWNRSYYVIKYGLYNLYRYSGGARLVQNGFEKQNEDVSSKTVVQSKKDDKKGKKDVKQQIKQQRKQIIVDQKKEQEIRKEVESRQTRTTMNSYWHLKLSYQMGRILYKQNRFKECINFLNQLKLECQLFKQRYIFLCSQGLILRSKIKLGLLNAEQFELLIDNLENCGFVDVNYIQLVCDYAETCDYNKAYAFLNKIEENVNTIITEAGLKNCIISQNYNRRSIQYCLELQLNQQQEEQVKRKPKKITEKKGGKDDKKMAKKQDPKKKKQENKVEYKIQPLSNYSIQNLNQQQKFTFQNIQENINSTEIEFNRYYKIIPVYLKYNIRLVKAFLNNLNIDILTEQKSLITKLQNLKTIQKIIKEKYENCSTAIKGQLYYLSGVLFKQQFLFRIKRFIKEYLQQSPNYEKLIKIPYKDLPRNVHLLYLPKYQEFIKQNRKILEKAMEQLRQFVNVIKNEALLFENSFKVEDGFWQIADICFLLSELYGRIEPKYVQQAPEIIQSTIAESNLQKLNLLLQGFKYLEFGIKVSDCKRELSQNYIQIGKKPFQPGAIKIDQDIATQILDMDYLYKKQYPSYLFDESKKKMTINYVDIMTYMLKMTKQSQILTFVNSHMQNNITKCHKFLLNTLPVYKQKCVISNLDINLKKDLNSVFIDNGMVCVKGKKDGNSYVLLYILGTIPDNISLKNTSIIKYGRLNIASSNLSKLSQTIFNIKEKMQISDTKSSAQKQRDYKFHRNSFEEFALQLGSEYYDKKSKIKELEITKLRALLPELTHENIEVIINMLKPRGVNAINNSVNSLLRYFHSLKYNTQE